MIGILEFFNKKKFYILSSTTILLDFTHWWLIKAKSSFEGQLYAQWVFSKDLWLSGTCTALRDVLFQYRFFTKITLVVVNSKSINWEKNFLRILLVSFTCLLLLSKKRNEIRIRILAGFTRSYEFYANEEYNI